MALNAKNIKRRIKSIGNTKKITKAMELVSAAKMRKAVRSALGTRAYATLAREMLQQLAMMKGLEKHPLMRAEPVKKILLLIVTSNRGLCGGLNANIFKKVVEQVRQPEQMAIQRLAGRKLPSAKEKISVDAVTVGKMGERMARKIGLNIVASFQGISDTPRLTEITPVAKILLDEFINKNYEKIAVIFTDFISAISQKPTIKQLLPISATDLEKMLREMSGSVEKEEEKQEKKPVEFIFEPSLQKITDLMLPRLTETLIFQTLLESSAAEHSARMFAMRNATDAALEMIDDLTFSLNQARQAGITREIAEIASGAAALD